MESRSGHSRESSRRIVTAQQPRRQATARSASSSLGFLDPVAALVIAGIAVKEGVELWQGEDCSCTPSPGWRRRPATASLTRAATAAELLPAARASGKSGIGIAVRRFIAGGHRGSIDASSEHARGVA